MRYTREQMARWDEYAILQSAKREGIEIGREEGIGIGEEKGRKDGREEEKEEIIRNLLASEKFNVGDVALYTGVSESVVARIKKSMEED